MVDSKDLCNECGAVLEESQYAKKYTKGQSVNGFNLACRNYPNCSKSEKDFEVKSL